MLFRLPLFLLLASLAVLPAQSARQRTVLDDGWKFQLGDPQGAQDPSFDDSAWRGVTLPHDWSIEQKIAPDAPSGGGDGFFVTGIGWYRLKIEAPASWSGQSVEVEFGGVYMDADVYLNGKKLTFHPYGYTGFVVDLAPALQTGTNVLAVRVDNSHQKNSRWYSGSGIYRHAWLTVADPVHVASWGVFASTPKADAASATVAVETRVANTSGTSRKATVETAILDPSGHQVAALPEAPVDLPGADPVVLKQELPVASPALWSPETPRLSRVVTRIRVDGKVVDEVETPFGIRQLAWTTEHGFTVNGTSYKLKGGCIHHDNGVLGACAFDRAEERKIELLKAAGFNALRTSHNPPSPEILAVCDRLGMLVMEEAFDCWDRGKNPQDYQVWFKDWWQRDLDAMVLRDRNHPSVVMWSIGNEVPDVFSVQGQEYGPKLADYVRTLDTSRPVTNGILGWPADPKNPKPGDDVKQAAADANWNSLDIVGTNYALDRHIAQHDTYPNRVLVSTESYPPLGTSRLVMAPDHPYAVGDFVWAAQDYLGECGGGRWFYDGDPTEPVNPIDPNHPDRFPFVGHGSDKLYPWHGDNSGILDLIGNEKPAARWRRVAWDEGDKLSMAVRQPQGDQKIHIAPWGWYPTWDSWTWPGWEGKPVEVEVYSTYPTVRLYLNDTLAGEKAVDRDGRAVISLPYKPGKLRAVGVQDGKEIGEYHLETADAPAAIRLTPDRAAIMADGQDLSFVKVEVVDAQGRLQPNADEDITFALTGPGSIAGLGNANLKGDEPYQGTHCHVFHGRALVVIRSTKTAGALALDAHADGLAAAHAPLQSQ